MRAAVAGILIVAGLAGCGDNGPTRPIRPSAARADAVGDVTVTNTNDDGPGSLRAAIAAAPAGATIRFDPSIAGQSILVVSALEVNHELVIEGPVATGMTIVGNGQTDLVHVPGGGNLTLRRLTLSVNANSGFHSAISINGSATIDHSLVMGASFVGVQSYGSTTVTNSTITANAVAVQYLGGDFKIIHTTIANNSNGLLVDGLNLRIENSVFVNNPHPCDYFQILGGVTTGLISDAECFGTPPTPNIGLLPLADNGGPTKTFALARTSSAIDVATCAAGVIDDQRGIARPQFAKCDAGAFEFNSLLIVPITVASAATLDPNSGKVLVNGTISCSEPITLTFAVTVKQAQKVKGVAISPQSSADVTVDCTGKQLWSVYVPPPAAGVFVTGPAAVTTPLENVPASVQTPATETAVKLFHAKK